jgi:glucose/arabinose dehydrogenase
MFKSGILLRALLAATVLSWSGAGCTPPANDLERTQAAAGSSGIYCDIDNGGIDLPDGFCALVVADGVGRARHLTVRDNGDIYVALREPRDGGGIAALRDEDGDGRTDRVEYFGQFAGTGIHLRGDFLYHAPDTFIQRYPLEDGALFPVGAPEAVVSGFPSQRGHRAKTFEFDDHGNLYVNIGAPSNACQSPQRTPGAAGQDPCPLLAHSGGVWRFAADSLGQEHLVDGHRFATGIRNGVANTWNLETQRLYLVQHGRDQLGTLWPQLYSDSASAELPAEELFEVDGGDDFGWPYCYYDHIKGKKVLAPEYGGDGERAGRCEEAEDPIAAFPGHWAPNDLVFYDGEQFPERYRGGAFIAFHGSWNRSPLEQQGYSVVFVPFQNGRPVGGYEVFADGFAGEGPIESSRDAEHRPMGLAVGPDGSLYISDSVEGKIWRVMHQ